MHEDNNNVGWNTLYGLGIYTGGGLWQEVADEGACRGHETHWRDDPQGRRQRPKLARRLKKS